MKFSSRLWDRAKCNNCDTVNWFYHGDVSDYTVPDIPGYECRSCGVVDQFDEDDDETIVGLEAPTGYTEI